VSAKYARIPRIVVDAFAAGMCLFLSWHAWRYLQLTREFGDTVLNDLPAWLAYGIVPLGFLLMGYRFMLLSVSGVLRALSASDATGESAT
jgi:TRAP-type C4-dicarboxylate transport system permease small subunit